MGMQSFHFIERLLVILGGIYFGFLGYRLFIFGVTTGSSKLDTKSPVFRIVFSGVGPGLFFMAFGALVLVASLFTGNFIEIKPSTLVPSPDQPQRAEITSTPGLITPDTTQLAVRGGKSVTSTRKLTIEEVIAGMQANLPDYTEAEHNIIRMATSPDRAKRLAAIDKIPENNEYPRLVRALQDLSKQDSDEEVRAKALDKFNKIIEPIACQLNCLSLIKN